MREVLRLDSPVPVTERKATRDDTLCGYFIPKGTVLLIPPTVVHVSPELWGEDASAFRPERFIEQGGVPETAKGEIVIDRLRLVSIAQDPSAI